MKEKIIIIEKICIMSFVLGLTLIVCAYSNNTNEIFLEARKAAAAGQIDFAFMHYYTILKTDPESIYKDEVLFAMGEYYYLLSNYDEAQSFFQQYLKRAEDVNGQLFAKVYLLKISEMKNDKDGVEQLEEEILGAHKHTFIFRSHKDYKFLSPLGKMHKAVYAIEQVKFYSQGELIAQISY